VHDGFAKDWWQRINISHLEKIQEIFRKIKTVWSPPSSLSSDPRLSIRLRAKAHHSTLFTAKAHLRCGQRSERTTTMAITASFKPATGNPVTGVLVETGDNLGNTITTSSNAAGQISVNNGAVSIDGGQPTVANTTEIVVAGGNGDDTISLGNAVLPPAQLFGGNGNDALTGGAGADQLFGGNGNDTLNGGDGDDMLVGGNGNDTVIGGKGTDTAFLGNGNDTFIWNPGDGNDVVDGGRGFDTLVFNGKATGEIFSIDANGSGATFNRANGTIDLTSVERIQFDAQGKTPNNITINDLTGTGVQQVAIDLGSGAPDDTVNGVADTVNIKSTNGQPITVSDHKGVVTVTGPASTVTISNFETIDHLLINGQPVTIGDGQSVTLGPVSSHSAGAASTATDGSHAAGLALLGQHMASSFVTAGDGHGGTPFADPPSSQQPSLTHPHA
jgi:Ca2+-binding RTX toxin-like protein